MRGDMEKFRSAMDDDPKIPGDDDNPDDQDLKAGFIGALGGAAAGAAIPGASAATGSLGSMAGGTLGSLAGPAGTALGSTIGGALGATVPTVVGSKIGDKLTGEELATEDDLEEYANEPDPQYGDMSDAIPDGNDLNRKKKAYPATQDGDNPMAVENIKATLMAALAEKKKPDADGDGVPDWADKKPGKDDNADKKAKKGTDESGQTKDCPKCGAPGKKKLMACSTCGCS